MDRHLKAFHELLALDSDKEVRTVGIWGCAGVGKTTLARSESCVYDEALQLFSRFAFKQPYPPPEFERFSVRAVQLAGFLPVAGH
ncbi:hypothetical protein F2Q70_00041563 [Brassica cretica]|uniref:NB-ARC domain-containing protein n=1 Tax=Brassica cretica TaxID=69181 RepID=A0A8S9K2E4_BRACR|nr:hypothetical protein F2Q70_00041563 [Brassica cretica]